MIAVAALTLSLVALIGAFVTKRFIDGHEPTPVQVGQPSTDGDADRQDPSRAPEKLFEDPEPAPK